MGCLGGQRAYQRRGVCCMNIHRNAPLKKKMLLVNRYLLNRLCFVLSVRVTVFHTALLAALFVGPVRSLFA